MERVVSERSFPDFTIHTTPAAANRAIQNLNRPQEKWDGTGYPKGLNKEQISLPARIITVADAYDAARFQKKMRKRVVSI